MIENGRRDVPGGEVMGKHAWFGRLILWGVFVALLLPAVGVPAQETAPVVEDVLPFKIQFTEVQYQDQQRLPPALQSYVPCVLPDGNWFLLGGRTQGLHTFNVLPPNANLDDGNFPPRLANHFLWVIHPEDGVLGRFDVSHLSDRLAEPLRATNQQYYYDPDRDFLYVVGGYGARGNEMVTFDTILRMSASQVAEVVICHDSDEEKAARIEQLIENDRDERLAVTGGALHWKDGVFYLVFGHLFMGQYTAFGSEQRHLLQLMQRRDLLGQDADLPRLEATRQFESFDVTLPFHQRYTEQIRTFTLRPGTLKILNYGATDSARPDRPFHRRDGNIIMTVDPLSGQPRIGAFGGVFRPGVIGAYTEPILMRSPGLHEIHDYRQIMNQYECPVIVIHAPAERTVYHTFFGGIGSHFYHQTTEQQEVYERVSREGRNDGLPFVADVSVLVHGSGGYEEYILPDPVPGHRLLGSGMRFLPNRPLLHNRTAHPRLDEVLDLDQLDAGETVVVGHVFGGIEADFPLPIVTSAGTQASSRVFRVAVSKVNSAAIPAGHATPAERRADLDFRQFRLAPRPASERP
jgi:hypothetical protein